MTDPYGEAHRKSLPVNCIDNTRPTLKASVKGDVYKRQGRISPLLQISS